MTDETLSATHQSLQQPPEDLTAEIYREALKETTTAVYDILRVIAEEAGAVYGTLEERTGLARSTIRYHVARLEDSGVLERIGNPVLVAFVSTALLDRAREITRKVRPDDQAEDMAERAENRRAYREEHQQSVEGSA
nr:Lrp/AsnC family transcriptional regulator [Salinarchaeum laminariae]